MDWKSFLIGALTVALAVCVFVPFDSGVASSGQIGRYQVATIPQDTSNAWVIDTVSGEVRKTQNGSSKF